MYKCGNCGKFYQDLPEGSGGSLAACKCGCRIFMKARPEQVRRVRAV